MGAFLNICSKSKTVSYRVLVPPTMTCQAETTWTNYIPLAITASLLATPYLLWMLLLLISKRMDSSKVDVYGRTIIPVFFGQSFSASVMDDKAVHYSRSIDIGDDAMSCNDDFLHPDSAKRRLASISKSFRKSFSEQDVPVK